MGGAGLNVHEGPQGIAKRYDNPTPLQEGMILSNEPGYYAAGKFGIRIENLLMVKKQISDTPTFNNQQFLQFEPLTLIPIQQKLIKVELLSVKEVQWIDDYHSTVRQRISPLLQEQSAVLQWLEAATAPLKVPQAAGMA